MRISWMIFLALILIGVGVQLNLTGTIVEINLPNIMEGIGLLILAGIIMTAISSRSRLHNDLGIMSVLTIVLYYFGKMMPIKEMLSSINSEVIKVISIILIIGATVFSMLALHKVLNWKE